MLQYYYNSSIYFSFYYKLLQYTTFYTSKYYSIFYVESKHDVTNETINTNAYM